MKVNDCANGATMAVKTNGSNVMEVHHVGETAKK
jgi:hypothetical protein